MCIRDRRYIDSFDVLEEPKAEPSFLLSQLPDKLREQGLELSTCLLYTSGKRGIT